MAADPSCALGHGEGGSDELGGLLSTSQVASFSAQLELASMKGDSSSQVE